MNFAFRAIAALTTLGMTTSLPAAKYQTTNFEVTAESLSVAQEIAQEAEKYRALLAHRWLNRPLDDWNFCCRIEVESRETGGTGWTSYRFQGDRVTRVGIQLEGSLDRLLEYVLPHELSHAVLVIELGKPMPRWADEGAAMLSESQSQKFRQKLLVEQLLRSGGGIPFRKLLQMADYPPRKSDLHAFYAQSLTLCEFLIARGGPARYLQFVQDGHSEGWDIAIHHHYKLKNSEVLQETWSKWVLKQAESRNLNDSSQIVAGE